jgi:proline iminopeptidase
MAHRGWMEEGQLLRDIGRIRHIPGIIVQGRYDACTPPAAAWDLHRAWPEAALRIIPDGGHAFSEPGILDGLIRAADEMAG